MRDEDASPVAELCERGMTLAVATDDDLAALRSAVQPVYDEIANDPANAAWLNQIEALKEEVDAPPATAECPQPSRRLRSRRVAFPNGTFVTTGSPPRTIDRACGSRVAENLEQEEIYAIFENGLVEHLIPLDDGTFEFGPFRATYTVVRDRVEILEVDASAPFSFHWTFDGTQLILSDPPTTPAIASCRGVWVSHPWVLVEDDRSPGAPRDHADAEAHRADHVRPDEMRVRLAMRAELSSRSATVLWRHTTTSCRRWPTKRPPAGRCGRT